MPDLQDVLTVAPVHHTQEGHMFRFPHLRLPAVSPGLIGCELAFDRTATRRHYMSTHDGRPSGTRALVAVVLVALAVIAVSFGTSSARAANMRVETRKLAATNGVGSAVK